MSTFWTDVATVVRRELLHYRRERAFLLGQILLPLLAVLLIGFGLDRPIGKLESGVNYASFLASGLLVLTISSGAIGGGYTLIQDMQRGFLRPILVAPVTRTSIVLGKIVARLLLSGLLVGVLLSLLAIFTDVRLAHPVIALAALVCVTFGFVALGILVATALRSAESFRFAAVFVTVPLYLLSGMFFPVASMPPVMRALALANPLTYGVDLFRFGTLAVRELPLALDVAVVLAFAIAPAALAVLAFERRLTR